jgi:diadenosine tetraphosphate (Ap4A) HIT family hydrolase
MRESKRAGFARARLIFRNALDLHMNSPSAWALHPQLAHDCVPLGDLPLCRLLLARDANYPWLILVPRRSGMTEIIHLDATDRARLAAETDLTARVLREVTGCDKLNIATLGNMVAQLHVHVIARRKSDAAWPKPVWGVVPPRDYDAAALDSFIAALRAKLWNT